MRTATGRLVWRDWPLYPKIALAITVLAVTMVVALTWGSMAREEASYRSEMELQAHSVVETVAISIQDSLYYLDAAELAKSTERLVVNGLVDTVRVYDPAGRVLIASDEPSLHHVLAVDPDGARVVALDSVVSTWSPDRLRVERPILDAGGDPLGGIAMSFSTAPLKHKLAGLRLQGLVAGLAALAAGLLFALPVTRAVTRPFTRLAAATEGLARGGLNTRIEVPHGRSEAAILGAALEDMRSELLERYTDLEDQVAARTRELAESNLELEAKNAELERFTYTVSHDLKSPLITIRGFCDLALRALAGERPDRLEAHFERISTAADTMGRLLTELLELSRVGRVVNPPQEVPAAELVAEAVLLVEGESAPAGVEIDVETELPAVRVDRTRVVEVFENLLTNAINATADEDTPRIAVGARPGAGEGDAPVFYVRDNGKGIEPQYHEKIFELFSTIEGKTTGTGVGLAIVKRIIEVHGGRIWVESEGAGHGAAFCFTLPLATPGQDRRGQRAPALSRRPQ